MVRTAATALTERLAPAGRAFYLHSPGGDIGHAVHLLRLLAALETGGRGRSLIFLRSPSVYPYGLFRKYGRVVRLSGPPCAASGRRVAAELAAFRPRVLVTEFFPFGRPECSPELGPALDYAGASGAAVVASVPMPYFTAPSRELPELRRLCGKYGRILVHSPAGADLPYMAKAVKLERRIAPADFSGLFSELSGKTAFTGYLLPAELPEAKDGGYVLAARGGGSTSGGLIEAAVGAAGRLGLPLVAVAGPSTPPAELRRFRAAAAASGGEIEITACSQDMTGLIAGASVCVSTAGGAVYEMLALRKRMVLAPFCGSKGREHSDQLARAWLMRDLAGAEVLLPGGVSAGSVAAAVKRVLAAPARISRRVRTDWFRGAERSAKIISGL